MPTFNQNRLWLLVSLLVLASITAPPPTQGSTVEHEYDDTDVRFPHDGLRLQLDTSTTSSGDSR